MSTLSCGPLLRYTYIDYSSAIWHGSLLIVLKDGHPPSSLVLSCHDSQTEHPAVELHSDDSFWFWRFPISVNLLEQEQRIDYHIQSHDINGSFWVPGRDESMRVMFHSCNGFSTNVPQDAYAGPSLWNDVLRTHAEDPFHVMIGGGDQIYSDMIYRNGPLQSWAGQPDPDQRSKTPFTSETEREIDKWYLNNYITWFSMPPFCKASATIPSIQIWDDHDIIDGYGSYNDEFMRSPIFLGIGKIAHKYYMLFQQHTAPHEIAHAPDPSFVVGDCPGPYIHYRSVSLCSNLGPRTVFYGLECRVERTHRRICLHSTYDKMFSRLEKEVIKGQTKHVVVLLGVPIAYPRLVWLEGLLSSNAITTLIRALNKVLSVGGGLFNKFDGSSELLDDLDDHWCARIHKKERNEFVRRLQQFSEQKGVRITILSGDVHLAAVGRFFSSPRLKIPENKDPRYMVNVISSAITNAPPPMVIANLMHRRNKLHHLDRHTQENLMHIFREDSQGKKRVCSATMPARNYAIITEHAGLRAAGVASEDGSTHQHQDLDIAKRAKGGTVNEHASAAAPKHGTTRPFALDVAFRVELDPKDPEGKTKSYGFAIPALELSPNGSS